MNEQPISILKGEFIATIVNEINSADEFNRPKLLNAFILEVVEYTLLNAYDKVGILEVLKLNFMDICLHNELVAQMKGN